MFLGIEIGGTKLQLAVGRRAGEPLRALRRLQVQPSRGAAGILEQIRQAGRELIEPFGVRAIGIGFGGPVDAERGVVIKSHHVAGWERFPLVAWSADQLGLPTVIGNDCDLAALAEAVGGAGRGAARVLFVTVGTGVGGGFVVAGRLQGVDRPAVTEIGHLRPGLECDSAGATVESRSSGWGIESQARRRIRMLGAGPEGFIAAGGELSEAGGDVSGGSGPCVAGELRSEGELRSVCGAQRSPVRRTHAEQILSLCGGSLESVTAKRLAEAAAEGNPLACEVLGQATQTLGWAVAQAITLLAPHVVVVGGGVSLMGESLFFEPLRRQVARYVFPPLGDAYRIVPAGLGEEVVLHGALALAKSKQQSDRCMS